MRSASFTTYGARVEWGQRVEDGQRVLMIALHLSSHQREMPAKCVVSAELRERDGRGVV